MLSVQKNVEKFQLKFREIPLLTHEIDPRSVRVTRVKPSPSNFFADGKTLPRLTTIFPDLFWAPSQLQKILKEEINLEGNEEKVRILATNLKNLTRSNREADCPGACSIYFYRSIST